MDADYEESQRDQILSRREKRWSMNSQRLEEIVAELMKPISDVRRSFDTDLCALLEEYLTEAGLHALEEGERGGAGPAHAHAHGGGGAPNFAELALLLQQSASIYGRKVDFLYQHVLDCSESLHNSTLEIANTSATEEPQTPSSSSRRKRKASTGGGGGGEFADISLEACSAARREAEPPRPPPTLPRMYIELEPRVICDADAPLLDYAAEPIGLLGDFHVTWRLHDGLLVDELEGGAAGAGGAGRAALRPLSLVELQAALEAAAPPLPPATPPPDPPPASPPPPDPLCASTPLPPDDPPPLNNRKRRSDVKIDDVAGGTVKILISKELRRKLSVAREFSIPAEWAERLVAGRKSHILSERRRLRAHLPTPHNIEEDFRGFDLSNAQDVGGFAGWSCNEAAEASLAAQSSRAAELGNTGVTGGVIGVTGGGGADSDDDGFFEQSSLGDSDASRVDDSPLRPSTVAEWSAWQAGVVARAHAAEARGGVCVRALAGAVLRDLAAHRHHPTHQQHQPQPRPFAALLAAAATHEADVSRLLLASLFLANAGNVEVVPGAPLSVNSFSLRLLSTDERLYSATAATEDQFLR